ncbi:MAG: ferric reductase [Chloroflexi bacterium]|nr:ferric reductase [Chloroflexota bacterium]
MTYRGLDPRTRLVRWGLFGIVVAAVLAVTLPAAAGALLRVAQVAPDRLPWVGTRLLGFLSYFAIAGSVVYGLLLSTKVLDAIAHRPVSFALHQDLSAIGLGLAGVHVALLGLDGKVPFTLAEMVVPFAAPYRPLWVGVGQLTLYVLAIVYASFHVRRQIGQRAWRTLHYVTFLAFAGSTAHGVLTGSDSGTAWAWWSYVVATALVLALTAYRVVQALEARRGAPVPPLPARAPRGPLDLRTPGR